MKIRMSTVAALAAILAFGSTHSLAAQRVARGPNFHQNSVKYSDAGTRPVTGRSGSASLEARALFSPDGVVHVQASTGRLDGPTAPGQIGKVQMKLLSADGKLTGTQNFDGRGAGTWTADVAQAALNGRVQLLANIGGIDGNRSDVVTVTVPVKRQPDVAVDGVTAPSRAIAGSPLTVVATVSERNGDVGARANCMLSIDGQLSDQAHGIWVDAGQTVSCAFQATMSMGSHQVTVYANGITPDDWDPTDNSASTTVEVLSPESPLAYSTTFNASDYDYYSHTKKSTSDGSFLDETTTNGTRRNRALNMTSTTTDTFVFPVQVRTALVADGSSIFDYTKDIAFDAGESTPTADCGVQMGGGYFLSVCNLRGSAPHSEVVMSSLGGRVTYFSSRFYQVDGSDGYITNTSSDTPSGVDAYPVSSSVQSIIELRDARGMLFTARPTISLQTSPISTQYGSCSLNRSSQVTTCSDGTTNGTSRTGSASAAGTQ